MANTITETKAQKAERLKREMNPWTGLEEIRRFAREGFGSITPEWIGTYFRWWGVYTQGDGAGVLGGKGGTGNALHTSWSASAFRTGSLLLINFGRSRRLPNCTLGESPTSPSRQNFQLHWVTIESLPDVLEALWACGLNTLGACGDVTRNITGCPLAGVDAHEICDASPLAIEANKFFAGNEDFYNLPRKFKISISGCPVWCEYPEINDIGLTGVRRD